MKYGRLYGQAYQKAENRLFRENKDKITKATQKNSFPMVNNIMTKGVLSSN
jgi:hypothetical protein